MDDLDFFAVCPPGLERFLAAEVGPLGFKRGKLETGGVSLRGDIAELWRANLELRGATRVLLRIGSFKATHFNQLEDLARDFDWAAWLRPDVSVRVEAATNQSKLYHAGAVKQRFERAVSQALGVEVSNEGDVTLKVRIDRNQVTLSLDSSGESLHKRGHKTHTGKAPIRETLAALLLRACDYTGTEAVVDPMCGSGTFILEAAEIAAGLQPGRDRDFAFEHFAGFDAAAFARLRRPEPKHTPSHAFAGYDRDAGAINGAQANAKNAGIDAWCSFNQQSLAELAPPEGETGLVILNPPYGGRIGKMGPLYALYGTLGKVMKERFSGWRIGFVTPEPKLAHATGLNLTSSDLIDNGGIKVKLYQGGID